MKWILWAKMKKLAEINEMDIIEVMEMVDEKARIETSTNEPVNPDNKTYWYQEG